MREFRRYDIVSEGLSRVLAQYQETNVVDILTPMLKQVQDIEAVNAAIYAGRSLENARGKQLDVIGKLVGQARVLIDASLVPNFGFQGHINAQSFGDVDDASIGGYFASEGVNTEGNVVLGDEEYRSLIKGRIARNHTECNIDNVIHSVKTVLNLPDLVVGVEDKLIHYTFPVNAYAKLNSNITLSGFDINVDISLSTIQASGVILGGNVTNNGSLSWSGRDLILTIDGDTVTWSDALPPNNINNQANIRIVRTGNSIKAYVDKVELVGDSTTISDSPWVLVYLGKDNVLTSITSTDSIHRLSVLGTTELFNKEIHWTMDSEAKIIPAIYAGESAIGITLPLVEEFNLTIVNYDANGWVNKGLGYVVSMYTKLSPLQKIIIKELGLLPSPIGIPVSYRDTNSIF